MLLPWSYLTHTQTQWSGRGCWLTLWGRARRDMHFKFFRYKVWSILLLNWSQLIMSPPPSDSLFPNPIIYYSPLQTVSFTISPPDACRVPHPLPVTGSAPPCTPVPKWTTTVPCSPINPNLIFSIYFHCSPAMHDYSLPPIHCPSTWSPVLHSLPRSVSSVWSHIRGRMKPNRISKT